MRPSCRRRSGSPRNGGFYENAAGNRRRFAYGTGMRSIWPGAGSD